MVGHAFAGSRLKENGIKKGCPNDWIPSDLLGRRGMFDSVFGVELIDITLDMVKDRKFVLSIKAMTMSGRPIYRIRACRDIPFLGVKKGDFGGWVEREENLSQEGDCWIFNEAQVRDRAVVSGDAIVANGAMVFESARISGNACVRDSAIVYGKAVVTDKAKVKDFSMVGGDSYLDGEFIASGNARINAQAETRQQI